MTALRGARGGFITPRLLVSVFYAKGETLSLHRIYAAVKQAAAEAGVTLPENWEHNIRARLQENCSDALRYRGRNDLFRNPERGLWGLR